MSTPQSQTTTNPKPNDITSSDGNSNNEEDANDTLLCLNFNQDGGCLAVGTAHGFRICNTVPFQETFRRTFAHTPQNSSHNSSIGDVHNNGGGSSKEAGGGGGKDVNDHDGKRPASSNRNSNNGMKSKDPPTPAHTAAAHTVEAADLPTRGGGGGGGIGHIEMLFRCNLLALVGGGNSPQYQKNKVLIWDDHCKRPIGELSFRHQVLTVKLRRDRICVALRDRVYVYNFGSLALLDTIVTGHNPLGLLCISTNAGGSGSGGNNNNSNSMKSRNNDIDESGMVLACPSVQTGQARVELYGRRKTVLIDAHESTLAAMALSVDGKYLCTASERGTILRLFSTHDSSSSSSCSDGSTAKTPLGVPLREFRRGVEQAKIESLCFSLDKCWLACASDRGTVHIFQVDEEDDDYNSRGGSSSTSKTKSSSKKSSSSFTKSLAKKVLPGILMSPKKYLLEGENSYVQVRGITYPKKCAFVAPHTIAIAGLDDCGNGCLLLASFGPIGENANDGSSNGMNASSQYYSNSNTVSSSSSSSATKGKARRIAYHRFFKRGKYDRSNHHHHANHSPPELSGQQLKLSDVKNEHNNEANGHEEGITSKLEEITFGDDDDGFVSITAENGGTDNSNDTITSKSNDEPAAEETMVNEKERHDEKKYSQ